MMPSLVTIRVLAVVACTLGACSLSISAPAADRRRNQVPECDTGKGLGASHQTGWTALIANLLLEMDED